MNRGEQQIESDLSEAVRDRAEQARLDARVRDAALALEAAEATVQQRRAALDRESRDVDRLESFSLTRIWAGLAGRRDADLDRETAEREAARYAVAEAEARRDIARREHDGLQAQRQALGDVDRRYRAALAAKDAWLRAGGGPVADEVVALAERRGLLRAEDVELAEAHDAGRRARNHLVEADRLLGSAESWSTWDTFAGGGMLTDMMKYGRIDDATDALRRADLALAAFARELADVGRPGVRGVEISGTAQFFDVFFDNIFSDFSVRSRVQDASARTRDGIARVDRALGEIAERGQAVQAELRDLERERERLLLRGGPTGELSGSSG